MHKTAIEMKGIIKRYDDKAVIRSLNLQVFQGECFGLLGPNGAGKSTLMKMINCISPVTDGEMFILGLNARSHPKEIKKRLGVVPQEDGLDFDLNVQENISIYGHYYGYDKKSLNQRTLDLLRLVRLEEYADREVSELSGGMKRRLAIARGMIHRPELMILDEPTTGLDPQARLLIWDLLKKLRSEMSTIVISTHYMEEAQQLCDRVAIMDQGRILALGSPKELIQTHIGREVVEFETEPMDLNYYLGRLKERKLTFQVISNVVCVYLQADQTSSMVLEAIASPRITVRTPTLNDVFLKLAGHELREGV